MKFLVTMKTKVGNPPIPPEQMLAILQAAKAYTEERLENGTFDCAYGFLYGDGFCVTNQDSHEAVLEDLLKYPQYPLMNWEIVPVIGAAQSFDTFIQFTQRQIG
jgi:muconolactone delta-isomerase